MGDDRAGANLRKDEDCAIGRSEKGENRRRSDTLRDGRKRKAFPLHLLPGMFIQEGAAVITRRWKIASEVVGFLVIENKIMVVAVGHRWGKRVRILFVVVVVAFGLSDVGDFIFRINKRSSCTQIIKIK